VGWFDYGLSLEKLQMDVNSDTQKYDKTFVKSKVLLAHVILSQSVYLTLNSLKMPLRTLAVVLRVPLAVTRLATPIQENRLDRFANFDKVLENASLIVRLAVGIFANIFVGIFWDLSINLDIQTSLGLTKSYSNPIPHVDEPEPKQPPQLKASLLDQIQELKDEIRELKNYLAEEAASEWVNVATGKHKSNLKLRIADLEQIINKEINAFADVEFLLEALIRAKRELEEYLKGSLFAGIPAIQNRLLDNTLADFDDIIGHFSELEEPHLAPPPPASAAAAMPDSPVPQNIENQAKPSSNDPVVNPSSPDAADPVSKRAPLNAAEQPNLLTQVTSPQDGGAAKKVAAAQKDGPEANQVNRGSAPTDWPHWSSLKDEISQVVDAMTKEQVKTALTGAEKRSLGSMIEELQNVLKIEAIKKDGFLPLKTTLETILGKANKYIQGRTNVKDELQKIIGTPLTEVIRKVSEAA
jgi:hypothetical protein